MSLYSKKQTWKAVLMILALVIVGASLWYSNSIVQKVRFEEREKVKLWSEAIQRRAQLVNYTQKLFEKLRTQERRKIDLYAEAQKTLQSSNESGDYSFVFKVIEENTTIPTIVIDEKGKAVFVRNLDVDRENDSLYIRQELEKMKAMYPPIHISGYGINQFLYYKDSKIITELEETMDDFINSFISETVINSASVPVILTNEDRTEVLRFGNVDSTLIADPAELSLKLKAMAAVNAPIEIALGENYNNLIFFEDSVILKKLKYYPFFQLLIIGLFLLIAYLLFSMFRKAEQNQVWVGMAKETAHQLGTPLSSLMAWVELFESKGIDKELLEELNKDVKRLSTITDRFSKIGSKPDLKNENILDVVSETIQYIKPRVSSKVNFSISSNSEMDTRAKINKPLFGWVIENLTKNAIDAMNGIGAITVDIKNEIQYVYVDISDTGKGILSKHHKTIFQPGYTTKERGWGLGLSLSKRIIENYHDGKIFVKRSEQNKGSTMRIVLKK